MPYTDPYGYSRGFRQVGSQIADMITQMNLIKQQRKEKAIGEAATRARRTGNVSEFLDTMGSLNVSQDDVNRYANQWGLGSALEGYMAKQKTPHLQPIGTELAPLKVEPPDVSELLAATKPGGARMVPEAGTDYYAGTTAAAPPVVQRQAPLDVIPEKQTERVPMYELAGGGREEVPMPTTTEGLRVRSMFEQQRAGRLEPGTLEARYTPMEAEQAIAKRVNEFRGTPEQRDEFMSALIDQYATRTEGRIDPTRIGIRKPSESQVAVGVYNAVKDLPFSERAAMGKQMLEDQGIDPAPYAKMFTTRLPGERPNTYEVATFMQHFGKFATPEQQQEFAETGVVPPEVARGWYAQKGSQMKVTLPQLMQMYSNADPEEFKAAYDHWIRTQGSPPPPDMVPVSVGPRAGDTADLSISAIRMFQDTFKYLTPEVVESFYTAFGVEQVPENQQQVQQHIQQAMLTGNAPMQFWQALHKAQTQLNTMQEAINTIVQRYRSGQGGWKDMLDRFKKGMPEVERDKLEQKGNRKAQMRHLEDMYSDLTYIQSLISGDETGDDTEGMRKKVTGRSGYVSVVKRTS